MSVALFTYRYLVGFLFIAT